MNQRVKERNKLKRKMASIKRKLVTIVNGINKAKGYDPAQGGTAMMGLYELESLQRRINALSADVDEKALLEQSQKRVQKRQ